MLVKLSLKSRSPDGYQRINPVKHDRPAAVSIVETEIVSFSLTPPTAKQFTAAVSVACQLALSSSGPAAQRSKSDPPPLTFGFAEEF